MKMDSESRSILDQIQKSNDFIETCVFRVETIEKRLKSKELLDDEREKYENELDTLKKLLAENREALKNLYRPNRQSFLLAAIIMLVLISLYVILFSYNR